MKSLLFIASLVPLSIVAQSDSTTTRKSAQHQKSDSAVVEVLPEYPGGIEAMMLYMQEETKYPKEARDKGIEGVVYMSFMIEKNGAVSNVTVKRGVHPLLDEEAIRVVSAMPDWSPGFQRGKPVKVSYALPVRFMLSKKKKKKKKRG